MSNFIVITRDEHSRDFTVISNHVLRDTSISYHARYLMTWLLTHKTKSDFKLTAQYIARKTGMSLTRVRSCVQELQDTGYLSLVRTRDGARYGNYIWNIHETPVSVATQDTIEDTVTEDAAQEHEAPTITEIITPEQYCFEQFWEKYPKKVDYDKARKAFLSIPDINTVFPQIMDALEVQIKSKQWTEAQGMYIPTPTNYLKRQWWNSVVVKKYTEAEMQEFWEALQK